MKNIELKIKTKDLGKVRKALIHAGAEKMGILSQTDIYFNAKTGRLKHREINKNKYELIYYQRPDKSNSKVSKYELISLKKNESKKILDILSLTNKIKVIVKKSRELWLYKNTRIHLDTVHDLGTYVELETVIKKISMKDARKEHAEAIKLFIKNKDEKILVSYCDLLLNKIENKN